MWLACQQVRWQGNRKIIARATITLRRIDEDQFFIHNFHGAFL
jgi:hypothetical protein